MLRVGAGLSQGTVAQGHQAVKVNEILCWPARDDADDLSPPSRNVPWQERRQNSRALPSSIHVL